MNIGQKQVSLAPWAVLTSAWHNRALISRLSRREIESRYRGSVLGIAWSVIIPVLMLTIYTFIFSVVFGSRWDYPIPSKFSFSLVLFVGLIIFNIFAECVTRAPGLMLSHVSYIKKVVFPLEVLPWVTLSTALFNAAVSLLVFFAGYLFFIGFPPWQALLLPVILIPLVLVVIGFTLFLSSVGVFVRDLNQLIGVVVTIFLFMTPIFYPVSSLPAGVRRFVLLSPLAMAIEDARGLLFLGAIPGLTHLALYLLIACFTAWAGYWWFMKTKKGFADVV